MGNAGRVAHRGLLGACHGALARGVACLSSSTELVMSTREESVTPGNRCEEWGGEEGGRKGRWRERKAEE